MVPELIVSDIERSLAFYIGVLGFTVHHDRPAERFAYLDREGAQIMLEQPTGRTFLTAELAHPYGRGMNLQIRVNDVHTLYSTVLTSDAVLHLPLEEKWYDVGAVLAGNHQFVVQDPDGYLLRFFEDMGSRAHKHASSTQSELKG